jgi:PAS domain-containing protein
MLSHTDSGQVQLHQQPTQYIQQTNPALGTTQQLKQYYVSGSGSGSGSTPTSGSGSAVVSMIQNTNGNAFYIDPTNGTTAYTMSQYSGHPLATAPSSAIHSTINGANSSDGHTNTLNANSQSVATTMNQQPLQIYNTGMSTRTAYSHQTHHSTNMSSPERTSTTINETGQDGCLNTTTTTTAQQKANKTGVSGSRSNANGTILKSSPNSLGAYNERHWKANGNVSQKGGGSVNGDQGILNPAYLPFTPTTNGNTDNTPISTTTTSTIPHSTAVPTKGNTNVLPGNRGALQSTSRSPTSLGMTPLVINTNTFGTGNSSISLTPKDGSFVKRRQDRNAREQKRSMRISQQINNLKELLENDGRKMKNSKIAILIAAEDYIRDLERTADELDAKLRQVYQETGQGKAQEKYNKNDSNTNNAQIGTLESSQQQQQQLQQPHPGKNENMNMNGRINERKRDTHSVSDRYNSNDAYDSESDSEEDEFDKEYEFRQEDKKNRGQNDKGRSSDSVSLSFTLPSKLEHMHMQNCLVSTPLNDNKSQNTGSDGVPENDINSSSETLLLPSSKRRRYAMEEVIQSYDLPNQISLVQYPSPGNLDHKTAFLYSYTALAIASEEGQILSVNKAFESLSGYSREELSKLTFFNLIHEDYLDGSFNLVARLLVPSDKENLAVESSSGEQSGNMPLVNDVKTIKESNLTKSEIDLQNKDDYITTTPNTLQANTTSNSDDIAFEDENILYERNNFHGRQQRGQGLSKLIFPAVARSSVRSRDAMNKVGGSTSTEHSTNIQLTISVGSVDETSGLKVFHCSLTQLK